MNTTRYLLPLLLVFTTAKIGAATPMIENITIKVGTEPRQTFGGFGTSLIDFSYTMMSPWKADGATPYSLLPIEQRKQLAGLVWKDAKFRTLKLWMTRMAAEGQRMGPDGQADFLKAYVESGVIRDAVEAGCQDVFITLSLGKPYLNAEGTAYDDTKIIEFTRQVAAFAAKLRTDYSVPLTGIDLYNEPNDYKPRLGLHQYAPMITALRENLDALGLHNVRVIAPSLANNDTLSYNVLGALKADPKTWAALSVVGVHSYNMAVTPKSNEVIGDKEIWCTESSGNGRQDDPDVTTPAARAAAIALNDLNRRVTRWLWFIGYAQVDPKDNQTRLIAFDATTDSKPVIFSQYYYLKHLADTFDIGAVFYECSAPDLLPPNEDQRASQMVYTHGKKPMVNAAVARNPDGTWAGAIINNTQLNGTDEYKGTDFKLTNSRWAGRTFAVDIKVPAAVGTGDVPVILYRSRSKNYQEKIGPAVIRKGVLSVKDLQPEDLITFRTVAAP